MRYTVAIATRYFNVSHAVLSGGVWKVKIVPSGAKPPIGNLAVAAYSGTGFNQLHCCFQDKDGYISDMILNGSNWSIQQVTGPGGQAGGPAAARDGNPAVVVYSGTSFNQMHYCYRDQDGNIQDAVYDDYGKHWSMQQVTGTDQNAKTNGPKAAGDVAVVVYSGDGFNQMHYCYRDQDGNIQDAAYDDFGKRWSIQQLTGAHGQTNGPAAAGDPVLFVYSGTGFNQRHCCYRDKTGYLQDAFWDANAQRWSSPDYLKKACRQNKPNTPPGCRWLGSEIHNLDPVRVRPGGMPLPPHQPAAGHINRIHPDRIIRLAGA